MNLTGAICFVTLYMWVMRGNEKKIIRKLGRAALGK